MSTLVALGIPLGLTLGLGLWMLSSLIPRIGRPRLSARVAPYLTDVSPAARELVNRRPSEPGMLIAAVASPVVMRARALLADVLGLSSVLSAVVLIVLTRIS